METDEKKMMLERSGLKRLYRSPDGGDAPRAPKSRLARSQGRPDFATTTERRRGTPYSLRHTYICMRLMEGADIYALAKNCRTSVEMIQKFYAAHIKNLLDTSAINVIRPKKAKRTRKPAANPHHDEY